MSARAELLITHHDGSTQKVELSSQEVCLIGRSKACTLQLNDLTVSRSHCAIEYRNHEWLLRDLGSTGGTLIGDVKVSKHPLKAGEQITLGKTSIKFLIPAPNLPKPEPSPLSKLKVHAGLLQELIGINIHLYQLEKVISENLQSAVYLAQHTKQLSKKVAVKVILPKADEDDRVRRRFIRSVLSLRELRHPHLVRLESAGRHGPYCWLAMEYVPGENLLNVIQRIGTVGMLDWRIAFQVALDIARALIVLEDAHVVHRNITPSSIIRTPAGSVKLGGTSLAKTRQSDVTSQITIKGELVGDLAYLDPEAITADRVDHRSDLYGLGATVYGLLTGRPPYPAGTLIQFLEALQKSEPPKPKQFQLSVSDLFEGAVMRMIARNPADRYQSATALVHDLERIGKYSNLNVH